MAAEADDEVAEFRRIGGGGLARSVPREPTAAASAHDGAGSAAAPLSRAGSGPLGLLSYLRAELTEEYLLDGDSSQYAGKSDRIMSVLRIPAAVERLIFFGGVLCLDAFLFLFTWLPIRVAGVLFAQFLHLVQLRRPRLRPTHLCDLLRAGICVSVCAMLYRWVDASRLYHSIRGQSTIKLYVLFNVLEVLDRLCSAFGQDLLDLLFVSAKTAHARLPSALKVLGQFCAAAVYVFGHALVIFYQMTTLNVAINSANNALLTLCVSNQFVELKGSVFKSFRVQNLFQLACSDIVERFTLAVLLILIAVRNLSELDFDWDYFTDTILLSLVLMFLAECMLDWIKHALIAKFNGFSPAIYDVYITTLCKDLSMTHGGAVVDRAHLVSRRVGFMSLPLACVVRAIFFCCCCCFAVAGPSRTVWRTCR